MINMHIVVLFNLKLRGVWHTFGGEIARVPGAVIKHTWLTAHIVLLGYYRICESL